MIRRVKIKGYKSLKDVEVELKPLTVIFGPNAAGKSNLFDALGLLSRMVTSNLNDAFDEKKHRGERLEAFNYGEKGIEGFQEKETAQFSLEVDVELSETVINRVQEEIKKMRRGLDPGKGGKGKVTEKLLRYSVTVEILTDSGHLRVINERLSSLKQKLKEKKRVPFIEKKGNRLHLRMEGQAHPMYHDIVDHTLVSTPLYAPHYPHITAFKEELSRWRFYYLDPPEMRKESPLKEIEALEYSGVELAAFFNSLRAKNERQFKDINYAIKHLLPAIDGLEIERSKKGNLQLRVIEGNTPFSAKVISEGTLRILGILAITNPLKPITVVGYEEPENGVHPRRLKLIADLFKEVAKSGNTQFIINTHSPKLPEYFTEDSLVQCYKEGNVTVFKPFASHGPLFRATDIEEALEEPEISFSDRILRGDFGG